MRKVVKLIQLLLAVGCLGLFAWKTTIAQDSAQSSSQETRNAVEKFSKVPATVGKSSRDMTEAAKVKLQQGGVGKPGSELAAVAGKLDSQNNKAEAARGEQVTPQIKRDPFRPLSLRTKTTARARENLSPLERFELGQLKIVGIILDLKGPRAMIEDTAGLGYIVKVGTPIGSSDGTVKAIRRGEVVVEEFYEDSSGVKRKREISMRLSTE